MLTKTVIIDQKDKLNISGGSQVAKRGAPEENLVTSHNNENPDEFTRWESEGGLTVSD